MAAVLPAAKEKSFEPPAGLLAWLAEKPHPGLRPNEPKLHWVDQTAKLHIALGFPTSLYDFCVRPRCSSKERDAETGLDNFLARYYSGPQGRFTSADEPFADQDADDPQSWNLFSYGRNNPLRYTDPTGQGCVSAGNNIFYDDDAGGSTCAQALAPKTSVTVTAQSEQVMLMMVPNMIQTLHSGANMVQQLGQSLVNNLSNLSRPSCTAAWMAVGSAVGYGGAALAAAGGFTAPAIPMSVGGGAAAGGAAGSVMCSSGTGQGGSSGSGSSQDKKLSPSEIKKLKAAGEDPELIKKDIVGAGGSKYDLFKTDSGEIVVKLKSGAGEAQPTGLNIRNF